MSPIRILVADDFVGWRHCIRSILERQPELQVVGEASDGLEAVQKAEELKPDLILLDIGLPHLNGIEADNRIGHLVPTARVLLLSQNNDAEIVHGALGDGAQGYVLKTDAGTELCPPSKQSLAVRNLSVAE